MEEVDQQGLAKSVEIEAEVRGFHRLEQMSYYGQLSFCDLVASLCEVIIWVQGKLVD